MYYTELNLLATVVGVEQVCLVIKRSMTLVTNHGAQSDAQQLQGVTVLNELNLFGQD